MRIPGFLLAGLLAAGSTGAATPVDYMQVYGECLKAAGRTNNGSVGGCSAAAAAQAQTEIDQLVGQIRHRLLAHLPDLPEHTARLADAQSAWQRYRDEHCTLAGAHIGGPMYDYCPLLQNIRRVEDLRELADALPAPDKDPADNGRD